MVKKYKKFINESDHDNDYHEYDDDNMEMFDPFPYDPQADNVADDSGAEYDSDMEYLCDTIESLFEKSGLSVNVNYDGLDISIFVFLEKKEKLKNLVKPFDVANKLKNDILPQYDSEFEIYENKEGDPIISFEFSFSDSKSQIDSINGKTF